MTIIFWIVGVVLLLAVSIVGIGMMMPRVVHVARSIEIDAPPDKVFDQIVDLRKFTEWSPWADKDPDMTQELNDVVGVGATMTWSGNKNVGQGKMEVIETDKPNSAVLALDFGGMGTSTAYWTIDTQGNGSKATWAIDADMGAGPMGRLMGPMMDKWVGADYERGLSNLKAKVETAP